MVKHTFLFEVGVEEIPASYIKPAITKLTGYISTKLKENNLSYDELKPYSTPRRFALVITGLQAMQKDKTIERTGPATRVAFDENKVLTKAGKGFLRGAGATEEDIFIKETPKGEYIAVKLEVKGRATKDILLEIIPEAVNQITFPKTMKWGAFRMNFARPVRWIVAMLDDEVIPVKVEHLESADKTYGNRFVEISYELRIPEAEMYEQVTRAGFVIADRDKRRQMIVDRVNELLSETDLQMIPDSKLLDTVCDLVEYPTPVLAEFPESYLSLPDKIITSTVSQNQKYFSLRDEKGNLSNKFVFISNGNPNYSDIIRDGNEKVVRPRLDDAIFYYQEDTKHSLAEFVPKLEEVTFQASLGTIKEKSERVIEIVKYMADTLGLSVETKAKAERCALLAKADLVTLMLGEKEFTKLQGYIGMKYALATGEDKDVALGIYEHYMPRGQNDSLPSSEIGALVAVADKLDTVCGIVGVDVIPTGSNDPFALRRAANGVVQIIEQYKWNLDLTKLIDEAFEVVASKLSEVGHNKDFVLNFFKQRTSWLLQQYKVDYDIIDSVLHIEGSSLSDLKQRAVDLQSFKANPRFVTLVLGFKRVSNIIAKAKSISELSAEYLTDDAEKVLYEEYGKLASNIKQELLIGDYIKIMDYLVDFGAHIDRFFDEVLVNTDNEKIKNNRYALLSKIRELFMNVSDLNKIVVEGNE